MIIKTTLTINGYKSKLSPKLQLYKGDSVFVEFTLLNSIISSINPEDVEISDDIYNKFFELQGKGKKFIKKINMVKLLKKYLKRYSHEII